MAAALALLLAACGSATSTVLSETTGHPEAAATDPEVTSVNVGATEPDASNCDQFFYDLFIGAYAIASLHPAKGNTEPTSSGAFESTPFVVDELIWVDKAAPQPIDLGEQRLATLVGLRPSQIEAMLSGVDPALLTAVLVPTEVAQQAPWRIAALITPDGINSGDVCSPTYTERVSALATALGTDKVTALRQLALYLRNSENPDYRPVGDFLAGVPTTSVQSALTPEDAWLARPIESRDLKYGILPKSFEPRVDVYAVSIVLDAAIGVGDLTFRCDLGVGLATVSNFRTIVRPLTTCVDAPTEVAFRGTVIGTIDVAQLAKHEGIEVAVSGPDGSPSITVRTLDEGELERLSGMTRKQLEELEATIKAGGERTTP